MRRLFCLLLLVLCLFSAVHAEELCPTSAWTAPDLTGLTKDDPIALRVLAVAQQEVGYQAEKGYENKYSRWLDGTASPWCTEFVAWCVAQADESCLGTLYPRVGTATAASVFYIKNNRFIGANGCGFDGEKQWLLDADVYLTESPYVPQPGDIMWLYLYGGRDNPDHSTLVEGVSRDESGNIWVHVIEGNMDSCVRRHAYRRDDPSIFGFGTTETRVYTCIERYSRYGGINELRKELNALGYDAGQSTLYRFDGKAYSALRAFQQDAGLSVTGKMDIATRRALNQALGENP